MTSTVCVLKGKVDSRIYVSTAKTKAEIASARMALSQSGPENALDKALVLEGVREAMVLVLIVNAHLEGCRFQ